MIEMPFSQYIGRHVLTSSGMNDIMLLERTMAEGGPAMMVVKQDGISRDINPFSRYFRRAASIKRLNGGGNTCWMLIPRRGFVLKARWKEPDGGLKEETMKAGEEKLLRSGSKITFNDCYPVVFDSSVPMLKEKMWPAAADGDVGKDRNQINKQSGGDASEANAREVSSKSSDSRTNIDGEGGCGKASHATKTSNWRKRGGIGTPISGGGNEGGMSASFVDARFIPERDWSGPEPVPFLDSPQMVPVVLSTATSSTAEEDPCGEGLVSDDGGQARDDVGHRTEELEGGRPGGRKTARAKGKIPVRLAAKATKSGGAGASGGRVNINRSGAVPAASSSSAFQNDHDGAVPEKASHDDPDWSCSLCTFINMGNNQQCDACGSLCPSDSKLRPSMFPPESFIEEKSDCAGASAGRVNRDRSGAVPAASSTFQNDRDGAVPAKASEDDPDWSCSRCTLINTGNNQQCDACGSLCPSDLKLCPSIFPPESLMKERAKNWASTPTNQERKKRPGSGEEESVAGTASPPDLADMADRQIPKNQKDQHATSTSSETPTEAATAGLETVEHVSSVDGHAKSETKRGNDDAFVVSSRRVGFSASGAKRKRAAGVEKNNLGDCGTRSAPVATPSSKNTCGMISAAMTTARNRSKGLTNGRESGLPPSRAPPAGATWRRAAEANKSVSPNVRRTAAPASVASGRQIPARVLKRPIASSKERLEHVSAPAAVRGRYRGAKARLAMAAKRHRNSGTVGGSELRMDDTEKLLPANARKSVNLVGTRLQDDRPRPATANPEEKCHVFAVRQHRGPGGVPSAWKTPPNNASGSPRRVAAPPASMRNAASTMSVSASSEVSEKLEARALSPLPSHADTAATSAAAPASARKDKIDRGLENGYPDGSLLGETEESTQRSADDVSLSMRVDDAFREKGKGGRPGGCRAVQGKGKIPARLAAEATKSGGAGASAARVNRRARSGAVPAASSCAAFNSSGDRAVPANASDDYPDWSCSRCTLINTGNYLQCDACGYLCPSDSKLRPSTFPPERFMEEQAKYWTSTPKSNQKKKRPVSEEESGAGAGAASPADLAMTDRQIPRNPKGQHATSTLSETASESATTTGLETAKRVSSVGGYANNKANNKAAKRGNDDTFVSPSTRVEFSASGAKRNRAAGVEKNNLGDCGTQLAAPPSSRNTCGMTSAAIITKRKQSDGLTSRSKTGRGVAVSPSRVVPVGAMRRAAGANKPVSPEVPLRAEAASIAAERHISARILKRLTTSCKERVERVSAPATMKGRYRGTKACMATAAKRDRKSGAIGGSELGMDGTAQLLPVNRGESMNPLGTRPQDDRPRPATTSAEDKRHAFAVRHRGLGSVSLAVKSNSNSESASLESVAAPPASMPNDASAVLVRAASGASPEVSKKVEGFEDGCPDGSLVGETDESTQRSTHDVSLSTRVNDAFWEKGKYTRNRRSGMHRLASDAVGASSPLPRDARREKVTLSVTENATTATDEAVCDRLLRVGARPTPTRSATISRENGNFSQEAREDPSEGKKPRFVDGACGVGRRGNALGVEGQGQNGKDFASGADTPEQIDDGHSEAERYEWDEGEEEGVEMETELVESTGGEAFSGPFMNPSSFGGGSFWNPSTPGNLEMASALPIKSGIGVGVAQVATNGPEEGDVEDFEEEIKGREEPDTWMPPADHSDGGDDGEKDATTKAETALWDAFSPSPREGREYDDADGDGGETEVEEVGDNLADRGSKFEVDAEVDRQEEEEKAEEFDHDHRWSDEYECRSDMSLDY